MLGQSRFRYTYLVLALLGSVTVAPQHAQSAVVVLCNQTDATVAFVVTHASGQSSQASLASRDVLPIPVAGPLDVAFGDDQAPQRRRLPANSVHYFVNREGKLDLAALSLSGSAEDTPVSPAQSGSPASSELVTIPVMLLVDDDEPAARRVWEKRLRDRLAQASAIFERCCRVRFSVVAVGTWFSNNTVMDFDRTLREFELTVNPLPARLAIGFTSQYRKPQGKIHMGGTRGPLHSHILIREWSQHVSASERLEILVHELGHYLGASHSPDPDSVMRPVMGDRRSNARSFRIGFDPVNTLVLNLVGDELRGRRLVSFVQMDLPTKALLRRAYSTLAEVMPEDTAAKEYLSILAQTTSKRLAVSSHTNSLIEGTRIVVKAVSDAAQENHRRPDGAAPSPETPSKLRGDLLTEFYVRQAATAASRLPKADGARAFLLGLGIALDSSTVLHEGPVVGRLAQQVDAQEQRRARMAVLGSPEMLGRADLAKHFVLSAALSVLVGSNVTEAAGITKELSDAKFRSGFSFQDLAADMAGTMFATRIQEGAIPLSKLATTFRVADFMPDMSGLPEEISWQDFFQQYGSIHDDRFQRLKASIRKRIDAAPGYRISLGTRPQP